MQIPSLNTDRLLLLPPSAHAEELYLRFYTDKLASHAYGGPLSIGAARSRLASDLGAWHLQGFGVWLIQRRKEGDLVGTCGFWQGEGWPRELTWWLLPEVRGAGVAIEASRAAIAHAYREFKWQTVETYMNDENEPARALVQRLRGHRVTRQVFPDGLERDLYCIPDPAYPSSQTDLQHQVADARRILLASGLQR